MSQSESQIVVPWEKLSEEALHGVIEEFILREGTDYGHSELTLEDKKRNVFSQLKAGHLILSFSPETESCTIIKKDTI